MNKITLILILIVFISCKEKPTYNPFDDQFNVSVRQLVRDKCDTIPAGCGYFNLTKNSGRFRPYYQIYADDFHEVVAKGFQYTVDSFKTRKAHDKVFLRYQMDSVADLPLDKEKVNVEFGKFGYQLINRDSCAITIANEEIGDTIQLRLETGTSIRKIDVSIHHAMYIFRYICYFKSPPTNH